MLQLARGQKARKSLMIFNHRPAAHERHRPESDVHGRGAGWRTAHLPSRAGTSVPANSTQGLNKSLLLRSLMSLAKHPSSKVQIRGAEKAGGSAVKIGARVP